MSDTLRATGFKTKREAVELGLKTLLRLIHKLLIIGERTGAFTAKVTKDLAQAASLIEFFRDTDPEAVREARADALSRGPGWKKRALEGRRALAALDSELAELLVS